MKRRSNDIDVLIVGAGPVGLLMALELHCQGINYRIVDKSVAPSTHSKALAIHARTLEIFENMGFVDDILAVGQKLNIFNIYAHKKRILHVTFDELESPHPYVISLRQSETERILIRQLEKVGGKVERQVELVEVTQNKDGVQGTLKFPDGSGKAVKASWLVACDGAHSTVRHSLNIPFEGSEYPEAFFLADVQLKTSLPQDEIHVFTENEGLLAVFPYGNDRFRLIADVPYGSPIISTTDGARPLRKSKLRKLKDLVVEKEPPLIVGERGLGHPKAIAKLKDPTLEEIRKLVDKRATHVDKVSDPAWLSAFTIHHRMVRNYRKERVFFAGDAAHIHSPAGGQGMNIGIQDAHNLAWKLALVIKGIASDDFLDTYHEERRGIAKQVLKMTDFMTRVNTSRNPVAKVVRTRLAPILVGQEVIQERLVKSVSELAINYRKSSIVDEHRVRLLDTRVGRRRQNELPDLSEWFVFDHGPEAGDRAPDGHLFDLQKRCDTRLFLNLTGAKHHLLLFAGVRSTAAGLKSLVEIGNFVRNHYSALIQTHFIAEDKTTWQDIKPKVSRFADPELSCHHHYGAGSECLYLIRPDGYVGFRSLPADKQSLSQYLTRIFC